MTSRVTIPALAAALALSAAPAVAAVTAPDPAVIQAIEDGYIGAWNRADPQRIAANFLDDGDFINPTGFHAKGPGQIAAFYAQAFAAGYAGSTAAFTPRSVRMVAPGVAVVDGEWSILGARQPTGEPRAGESGLATAVLVNTPVGWRVSVLREQSSATRIVP